MPGCLPNKLEDQRKYLIKFISEENPQGSRRNSVTIVFDGQPGIMNRQDPISVKILFSCHETADDKIKTIVDQAQNRKNIIVVTDDRNIQYAVRASGAKVLSVKDFLGKASSKEKRSKVRNKLNTEDQKRISYSAQQKITEEFEKMWVKKKKKAG